MADGQTQPAPVNVLPELLFDLSEGQPLPATRGRTEVPVALLPDLGLAEAEVCLGDAPVSAEGQRRPRQPLPMCEGRRTHYGP